MLVWFCIDEHLVFDVTVADVVADEAWIAVVSGNSWRVVIG